MHGSPLNIIELSTIAATSKHATPQAFGHASHISVESRVSTDSADRTTSIFTMSFYAFGSAFAWSPQRSECALAKRFDAPFLPSACLSERDHGKASLLRLRPKIHRHQSSARQKQKTLREPAKLGRWRLSIAIVDSQPVEHLLICCCRNVRALLEAAHGFEAL